MNVLLEKTAQHAGISIVYGVKSLYHHSISSQNLILSSQKDLPRLHSGKRSFYDPLHLRKKTTTKKHMKRKLAQQIPSEFKEIMKWKAKSMN